MTGTVYLVGAGPGTPDLLTLRAARLLGEADILFYDALVNPEIVALAARAEKVAVGKRCGRHSAAQRFINKRLVDAAQMHPVVVRLKGGDPMLFGRAQEEIEALEAAGVAFEVVPGVTAALAASADLGVSLTRRGISRSVAFVTPRTGEGEARGHWVNAAASADTAVIYMGAGEAEAVSRALVESGRPGSAPAVIVESASLPQQRRHFTTIDGLAAAARALGSGPALILIGEVYRDGAASVVTAGLREARAA